MDELNVEQKKTLLRLARKTIADRLNAECENNNFDFSDAVYNEKCGAFVTLHIKGNLRGCIGYIEGVKPVPDTIREMALSSAFRDPRFSPLTAAEFKSIDIEISILSPIVKVENIDDIVVGRDGLIISKGFNRGLLLPQVPVEQKWDRDTFLTHTCFKAGLPGDTWKKPGVEIEKFSAQVFSEKELGLV
ncbi:MAG TPA: AmmeMemoRadiSam system protein A [Spirochaetota bacterium]|nr:AmmeMemoRadiSam system protein A [Spirochaetota bacterium]HPF05270.1 AmmeMemoRadiSam system protein A [Spirochaetota bacterium]HPJ40886.1 AmmeMemoRadiSam system protein A [Spirochaetota bacterium]HPR37792.1 AmmeMemoRadiSam system protein A [Spirochaetota bacterium]HRX46546.1 AmmeMemoRadiSam system protein A [Spirochaetota bacterium]